MKFVVFSVLLAAVVVVKGNVKNVGSFTWGNCNPADPILVTSLSIGPDPIVVPGQLLFSISIQGSIPIVSPTPANFTFLYRANSSMPWELFPCFDRIIPIGSCGISDVCALLDILYPTNETCPQGFIDSGVTCRCPFDSSVPYVLNGVVKNMTSPLNLFSEGDYQVKLALYDPGYAEIMCVDLTITIVAAPGSEKDQLEVDH